ncbi:hypothetical protein DL96DRAFT_1615288 [Flagelloscypha sp. PMI_526]|nr:hypothetical protein DL96DRAFT_1615288 [Flagelloscypha sp. PMI_526]
MKEPHLRRVSHLWFSDGGVVLQAGPSLFRVYQGILSAQSTVFRDMFSFAQPATDEANTYEGCPLIILHDDEREAESFLRALFDPSYLQNFIDLSGYIDVLRLSHKYNCEGLKRPVLRRLTKIFVNSDPSSSKDFMKCPQILTRRLRFHAIVVCIETQCSWLVPHLILNLFAANDDVETGIRRHSAFLQHSFRRISYTCQIKCNSMGEFAALIADDASDNQSLPLQLRGQFRSMESAIEGLGPRMGLQCFNKMKNQISLTLTEDWAKFPEYYGLPSWSKLDDQKMEAIG